MERYICKKGDANGKWGAFIGEQFNGPRTNELVEVESEIGRLTFSKYPLGNRMTFTETYFEKLVSDSELESYRERVSKREMEEFVIVSSDFIREMNMLELEEVGYARV